jgi:hypothetical protein
LAAAPPPRLDFRRSAVHTARFAHPARAGSQTGPSSSPRSCEAGACGIWANLLFLRPGTREHFLTALAEDFPDEVECYERLYTRRAYLGKEQTKPVREEVAGFAREHEIRDRRHVGWSPSRPSSRSSWPAPSGHSPRPPHGEDRKRSTGPFRLNHAIRS